MRQVPIAGAAITMEMTAHQVEGQRLSRILAAWACVSEQVRLSSLVGGIGTKIVLAESQLVGHTSACARSFRHRSSLATPNRRFHSLTNTLFKGNQCACEPTDARTPGERTTSEAKSRAAVKECRRESSKDGLCDGAMLASATFDA